MPSPAMRAGWLTTCSLAIALSAAALLVDYRAGAASATENDAASSTLDTVTASPDALYRAGRRALAAGQYETAVRWFEAVLAKDGAHRGAKRDLNTARRRLAHVERKQQQAAERIAAEEVAAKREIADRERAAEVKRLFEEGVGLYRAAQYAEAMASLERIAVLDPNSPYVVQAQRYLSRSEAALHVPPAAVGAVVAPEAAGTVGEMETQLIGLKSEVAFLIKRAQELMERGYYAAATDSCQQVLAKDPHNKQAQQLLDAVEQRQIHEQETRVRSQLSVDDQRLLHQVGDIQRLPEPKPGMLNTRPPTPLGAQQLPIHGKLRAPVTVDFRDVDLGFVLNFLSEETGVNIVPSSGVSLKDKRVTIKIKDMPMDAALKYILQNQGLAYRVEPDAVLVSTREELEKEELETRVYFLTQGAGIFTKFGAPSTTGSVQLGSGGSVAEVTTIKDVLEKAVSGPPGSKITLDERTGALIVTNTPTNLKLIEEILYNLDTTPIQVLIEARFIEVSATDLEERGAEVFLTGDLALDKTGDPKGETRGPAAKLAKGSGINFTDLSRKGEGLDLTFQGVLSNLQYENALHFLDEVLHSKTLSAPRITTINNQTATIKVVDEFTVPTRFEVSLIQFDKNGDGDFNDAGETEFANVPQDFVTRPIGILLNVTPSVGADNKTISLTMVPEVSEFRRTVEFSGKVQIPEFTFRTLTTSVVMHDGETVVLGGLIKETDSKSTTKVPVLGDIPLVGGAFRRTSDKTVRSNLLIFVTARILTPTGSPAPSAP